MRKNLINARNKKGLTQNQVAQILNMSPNAYQKIEYGSRGTAIEKWDKLEDLFDVPQRYLRENITKYNASETDVQ